jgi:hypothetical protein
VASNVAGFINYVFLTTHNTTATLSTHLDCLLHFTKKPVVQAGFQMPYSTSKQQAHCGTFVF